LCCVQHDEKFGSRHKGQEGKKGLIGQKGPQRATKKSVDINHQNTFPSPAEKLENGGLPFAENSQG
jgi:hypothetical protein